MKDSVVSILLVDDDDVDAETVERAFRKAKITNPIYRASDGVEALEMLRGTGGREPIPYPHLILLDLKMPRMGGLKFLEALRNDPALRENVVFVLTTSAAEQDRLAAYENFVAGYIIKSQAGRDFTALIDLLDIYWRVVELPPPRRRPA